MSDGFPLEDIASLPELYHPVASPSGDVVAFYWDVTGRNELHLLDVETGDVRQLSDGDVPRSARWPVMWAGDGERVYFHRDEDGDEQNDVYAIDRDGNVSALVTLEGQCILQDAARGGDSFLFASTAGGQLNLYRYDHATGDHEQLTDHERPVFTATCGPDGERVAYVTNESENRENRDVYVVDADGSESRRLDVGEDGSEAGVADWHPDGRRLLVSDNASDVTRCGIYDLATDEVAWVGPGEHEESPIAFAPDGDSFLARRIRRAAAVPVHYDLDGGGRELDLPEGVASGPSLGVDCAFLSAETALLLHETPTSKRELLACDLGTDEHETLVTPAYGDVDPAAFTDAEYVTYESTDGLEIGGLLYDSDERPSPAIVHVHGGPHWLAMKSFDAQVQYLVSEGYTVFQPNYRGSVGRGREFKNMIHGDWGGMEAEDIAEAGRWLESREWVDEDRVAVFGASYGGYSTYVQLVKHPGLWATGVAWVGMTDLHRLFEEDMPHFKSILREQMGDPEENYDLWRERSPVEHVDAMERPILIAHGVNDPRCPISQARLFRDALEERGWVEGEEFEYVELGEEGHGTSDIDQKIRTYRILADYLDRRL